MKLADCPSVTVVLEGVVTVGGRLMYKSAGLLVTLETMFKAVKNSLAAGENIYIRGFGSFITKKRAAKIGRNIKKNVAVEIPEHFIPAFKPAKEFMLEIKSSKNIKETDEKETDESGD